MKARATAFTIGEMEKAAIQYLTFVVFVSMLCIVFFEQTGTFDPIGITGSRSRIGNETKQALEKLNMALRLFIENETRNLEKVAVSLFLNL